MRLVNRFTSLRLFDTRERRKQTRGGEAPPDPPFDPSFGKQHKRELRKGLYAPAGPSGRPLNRVFDSAVKTLPPSVLLLFTSAGKIQPPKTPFHSGAFFKTLNYSFLEEGSDEAQAPLTGCFHVCRLRQSARPASQPISREIQPISPSARRGGGHETQSLS